MYTFLYKVYMHVYITFLFRMGSHSKTRSLTAFFPSFIMNVFPDNFIFICRFYMTLRAV